MYAASDRLVCFHIVSGKTLVASGGASTAKVVGHSYGAEAEAVARSFGRSVEREFTVLYAGHVHIDSCLCFSSVTQMSLWSTSTLEE